MSAAGKKRIRGHAGIRVAEEGKRNRSEEYDGKRRRDICRRKYENRGKKRKKRERVHAEEKRLTGMKSLGLHTKMHTRCTRALARAVHPDDGCIDPS